MKNKFNEKSSETALKIASATASVGIASAFGCAVGFAVFQPLNLGLNVLAGSSAGLACMISSFWIAGKIEKNFG